MFTKPVVRTYHRTAHAHLGAAFVLASAIVASIASCQAQQGKVDPAAATTSDIDVTGIWIDHTKRGAIEIVPCGQRVCGYVYWMKDLMGKNGKPLVDDNNPDPARRGKPFCGTQILIDVAQKGRAQIGHVWTSSNAIYAPEEGKRFDVELKLISANELNVAAFIGVKMFGEQFKWTRAPADLTRCGPPRV